MSTDQQSIGTYVHPTNNGIAAHEADPFDPANQLEIAVLGERHADETIAAAEQRIAAAQTAIENDRKIVADANKRRKAAIAQQKALEKHVTPGENGGEG